jgi:hypothetical protein
MAVDVIFVIFSAYHAFLTTCVLAEKGNFVVSEVMWMDLIRSTS